MSVTVVVHRDGVTPPEARNGGGQKPVQPFNAALMAAADTEPGVWVSAEADSRTHARNSTRLLRKYGYEATARVDVVWVRKAAS